MSKAFTKESDNDLDDVLPDEPDPLPRGQKNYITPAGFARLRDELRELWEVERFRQLIRDNVPKSKLRSTSA